jgi:uncharacterized protein YjiK
MTIITHAGPVTSPSGDLLDYDVFGPQEQPMGTRYVAHVARSMELAELCLSTAVRGSSELRVQILIGGVPLFVAPVAFPSGERLLRLPKSALAPVWASASVAAGVEVTAVITGVSQYDGWRGLRLSLLGQFVAVPTIQSELPPFWKWDNYSDFQLMTSSNTLMAESWGSGIARLDSSLLILNNNPPRLVEVTLQGVWLREFPMQGFVDTEGLTALTGRRVAVLEEGLAEITVIDLPADGSAIVKGGANCVHTVVTGLTSAVANLGFEALTWLQDEPGSPGFFSLLREGTDDPLRKIYTVANYPVVNPNIFSSVHLALPGTAPVVSDFCWTPYNTLLILMRSGGLEGGAMLCEVTADGRLIQSVNLTWQPNGRLFTQPEGVSMSPDGREIYISCEPGGASAAWVSIWKMRS